MAWFLTMQGPTQAAVMYQLQGAVDIGKIAEEMASAATLDRVVAVPAVLQNNQQDVTLYVRPAAWGAWTFYQLTDEERKKLAAANPLLGALSQAARQARKL
jgi:hypothetical protein